MDRLEIANQFDRLVSEIAALREATQQLLVVFDAMEAQIEDPIPEELRRVIDRCRAQVEGNLDRPFVVQCSVCGERTVALCDDCFEEVKAGVERLMEATR